MVNNYGWVASEFHSNMFKETQPKTLDVSQRFRPWLVVKIAVSHTDGDSPTESCTVRLMVENDGKRLISRDSSVNTSGPFAPNRKRHTHTHTHIEEKFKFHSGGRHAGFFIVSVLVGKKRNSEIKTQISLTARVGLTRRRADRCVTEDVEVSASV